MTETIHILVADDHAIVREGLRWLIATEPGMELVGEAADGVEAVARARELRPDIILMDVVMPRKDGIEAISEIKQALPDVHILVLTSFAEDDKVFPAIKAGASGYLLKDTAPQDLLRAIRDVHQGLPTMHPAIARKVMQEIQRPSNLPPTAEPLTAREADVLKLVARGLANEEIAKTLFISERTVRTHVSNILRKLHLANRTQATLYALREGLVNLSNEPPP
ncbi:MAG TPA: response regulator transcription factor [Anaerolineae bacterium]|nr:response regulator transcription factor [Anaerolineae bacterium]HQH38426.1 response regulator transcription factor [Anaerolineae bacterium]